MSLSTISNEDFIDVCKGFAIERNLEVTTVNSVEGAMIEGIFINNC